MTWRRFLVLLQGLSADSALAMSIRSEQDGKKPEKPAYDSDEKAEQALMSMLGVKKAGGK